MDKWIGDCHLMRDEGNARENFQSRAAVLCSTHEEFERLLQRHLNKQGLHLLWTQNVCEATKWLAQNGQNSAARALVDSVHEGNPVALAETNTVDVDGKPIKEAGYLTITDHTIAPLPDQTGIPFWDAEWIAPDLKELLFGQPENGDTLRTYFIVDATLRKNITGLFDLDVIDVPVQCLFKGDAAEELKETAPYLIDMTLPEGAWDDKSKVPAFHKDFFARHWGHNTGIFIRTTAFMAEVWGHFRKFTQVQVEEDKRWVFFRFWDPRISSAYFRGITDWGERIRKWYPKMQPMLCILAERSDGKELVSIAAKQNELNKKKIKPTMLFQLTELEITVLRNDVIYRKMYDEVARFSTLDKRLVLYESKEKFAKIAADFFKENGFKNKKHIGIIAQAMWYLGPAFVKEKMAGQLPCHNMLDESMNSKYINRYVNEFKRMQR